MKLYLFVSFCLFLGQTNRSLGKNIETTDKPSLDCDKLVNFQTKLLGIQDEIISITAAMGIVETLDSVIDKIAVTVEKFYHLKKQLDSERQQIQELGECSRDAQTMITNHHNAVEGEIKNLQSSLKACREKRLPSETIADIKAHRFEKAEQKLKQFKNFIDVFKIFQEAYDSLRDYNIFTRFLNGLTDINVIDFSVRALKIEMAKNNDTDPLKLMSLVKTLEKGVINKPNVDDSVKYSSKNIAEELRDTLKDYALGRFNTTVGDDDLAQHKLKNLVTLIYFFDPMLSERIIKEFVNTNYGCKSSKKILETIESQQIAQLKVEGISSLLQNINKSHNLNSDVTIKIASALRRLRLDSRYKELNKTQQDEVGKLINNLPICARNLFFSPSVCLWNKERQEYLTAGDLSSKYDKSRRNIVFSMNPLPESHWYVNTTGDNFLFSSQSYDTEYLYAAAFNFTNDLRYVFNWIPGDNTDKQSEWSIELNGDYCYLKSAAYNEYLFSSKHITTNGNNWKYAFTWIPGHSVRESQFQWQIRQCDNV